jgi:hypothetical protein
LGIFNMCKALTPYILALDSVAQGERDGDEAPSILRDGSFVGNCSMCLPTSMATVPP